MATIEEARMRVALCARRDGEELFAREVEAGAWDESRNDIRMCLSDLKNTLPGEKFWLGPVPLQDDFGQPIIDEFIDAVTTFGLWGFMTPASFKQFGLALGNGRGQRYKKLADGRWLKVEG